MPLKTCRHYNAGLRFAAAVGSGAAMDNSGVDIIVAMAIAFEAPARKILPCLDRSDTPAG